MCIGMTALKAVTFEGQVKKIYDYAFQDCSSLKKIIIPETVTTIGSYAFSGCSSLTTIYANPITPPSLGSSAFANTPLNEVYVQCGSANAYRSSSWNTYCTNFIEPEVMYSVKLHSADTTKGQVVFDQDPSCDNTAIIRAIPSLGYRFTTWNDGVTTNPRTLLLSQDTTFTANFELMLLDAEYATICYGESYTWDKNGQTYTEAGTYTTITSEGEVTLHLTILPEVPITNDSATICYGETYTWNGQTYSTEGDYNMTLQNVQGCDSVVILHLTVNPIPTIEETIIACDSYIWNDSTYTQSGDYVYTTTAANGCDSIVTLHLTIYKSEYIEETVTSCDSYAWNGQTYTESGDYTYTITTDQGCEHIEVLHLTIYKSEYVEETITACDSYEWNSQTYTESGDYTYTTTTDQGCERLEVLHLTINKSEVGATEYATICYGETYTWNGQTYSTAGEYSITLSNALGCDSVATLHLTIMPEAVTTTETVVIGSDALPYTWRGNTYTATGRYTKIEQYTTIACDSAIHILDLTVLTTDNYDEQSATICDTEAPYLWYGESYTTTGKYTFTEQYVGTNIDSIQHILNLTVNPTIYTEEYITACDSYTWNGQTYTTTGAYTYTTTAANGCDSIVTLHLTINKSDYVEETVTACDSYKWNTVVYTESGDYTYITTTDQGCERVEVLHLTIHRSEYVEETVTACDSYEWNGVVYTKSGDYTYTTTTDHGCEHVEVLHLTINKSEVGATEYATICHGETYTWNGQSYSATGEYTQTLSTTTGCDSIVTLYLTILPETIIVEESVTINEEYLPYAWRGQQCYSAGTYNDSEPFANYPYCDSVIYVLNLTTEATNKCGDHLYWHYSNNTMTITGSGTMYDDPDILSYRQETWYPERVNHIVLPDGITHIGNVAFADCANLTSISLPSSLTSLGDGAFSWTGLQSVTIPVSVTTMGEQVFEACNDLRTILYEGNPTIINNQTIHPFIGCTHLDTIITPAALWHCTSADQALEARYGVPHKARYIEVTDGELTKQAMSYIAQNSSALEVLDLTAATNTTLPLGALMNSYRLSYLYLPEQIQTVPEMLAEGCYSLMEIIIPATVTEIGNYAFAGCINVWQMTVDAVVPPTVYAETFKGIDRNISVIVPAESEEAYRQAAYWQEFFIKDTNSPLPITNCQKILREDQILILRNGQTYTMMGQPVNL